MRSLVFVLASLLAIGGARAAVAADLEWMTSQDDAMAKAKEQKKFVLESIVTSEVDTCQKLKTEIFASDEFKKWAAEKVVLVEIDVSTDQERAAALTKEFGIKGYPAVLFLDADGKEIGRSGYVPKASAKEWITDANTKLASARNPNDDGWLTNYDDAVKRARKEGKLILANFTGSDWCPWCIKLHDEVLDQKAFKDWASANVVLLLVDHPHKKELPVDEKTQNDKLDKEYNVNGFPTVLFLDAKGKKKGQMGYKEGGAEPWVKEAGKIAGNKKAKKPAAAGTNG